MFGATQYHTFFPPFVLPVKSGIWLSFNENLLTCLEDDPKCDFEGPWWVYDRRFPILSSIFQCNLSNLYSNILLIWQFNQLPWFYKYPLISFFLTIALWLHLIQPSFVLTSPINMPKAFLKLQPISGTAHAWIVWPTSCVSSRRCREIA